MVYQLRRVLGASVIASNSAAISKGRSVHPRVRLLVTPASQQTFLDALHAGYVATLAGELVDPRDF